MYLYLCLSITKLVLGNTKPHVLQQLYLVVTSFGFRRSTTTCIHSTALFWSRWCCSAWICFSNSLVTCPWWLVGWLVEGCLCWRRTNAYDQKEVKASNRFCYCCRHHQWWLNGNGKENSVIHNCQSAQIDISTLLTCPVPAEEWIRMRWLLTRVLFFYKEFITSIIVTYVCTLWLWLSPGPTLNYDASVDVCVHLKCVGIMH